MQRIVWSQFRSFIISQFLKPLDNDNAIEYNLDGWSFGIISVDKNNFGRNFATGSETATTFRLVISLLIF